ncbi:hypothetical protein CYMTET_27886 [Cymbomonas tetramitiformis]|uniref:Uncharacterized protein n=1 Tax=Cymbomonas tetramitiformis TaxID=36881 RepID=A0AAE0KWR5_9CHLO|nr:hypothetical protein CYMTET_27886 [Cymbomonas tetramitiformis]
MTSFPKRRSTKPSSSIRPYTSLPELQEDLDKDNVLSSTELERVRKLAATDENATYEKMLKCDKNQDGVLDAEEVKYFQDMESGRRRMEILEYLEGLLCEIVQRKGHYVNMFTFISFVCFYFAILFYQRKAFLAYDITHAISMTVLPTDGQGDYAKSFTSEEEIYEWLVGPHT